MIDMSGRSRQVEYFWAKLRGPMRPGCADPEHSELRKVARRPEAHSRAFGVGIEIALEVGVASLGGKDRASNWLVVLTEYR